MSAWWVLAGDWTPEIKARCAKDCAEYGDPPCWATGDQGQIGGEIQEIRPCEQCAKGADDES